MAHSALVIDNTVGGANANSYVTLVEVEDYLITHRNFVSSNWTGTDAEKTASIIWAMGLIETRIKWSGLKKTTTQALDWPRYHVFDENGHIIGYDYSTLVYIIPDHLKHAVCELTYLMHISDRTAEPSSKGLNKLKVDVIELDFDSLDVTETIPESVMGYLTDLGFLKGPGSSMVSLVRV